MDEVLTILEQGGWPMIPLAVCSVVAVTIIIERAVALRRRRVIDPRVVWVVDRYEGEGSVAPSLAACGRSRSAFARIVAEIVKARHLDHAQAIESMHAVGRTQVGRLERGLTLLEIIGGISPLIGLLCTVLGMVEVFNAITASGMGDPQVLSEGISRALITTVAGLCVAIPAVAFYSLYAKRVDTLATEMQDRATAFIVRLQGLTPREE